MRLDPNTPCDTCALGTICRSGDDRGAADEVRNRLRAEICARAGIPFFCHHSRSGPQYDWRAGGLGPLSLPPGERRLCAGWKARVKEVYPRDLVCSTPEDTAVLRRYQRGLGNEALDAVDRFIDEKDPARKVERRKEMRDLIRAVKG